MEATLPESVQQGLLKDSSGKKAGRIPQEGLQRERDCSICHGASCSSILSRHQRHWSSQLLVPATFDISEYDHWSERIIAIKRGIEPAIST
jgi:hypothetical protein